MTTAARISRSWVITLAAIAVIAGVGVALTRRERADAKPLIVLRMAHWNLWTGLREGYDEVIAQYEHAHPGVKIQQIGVPLRVWPSWQQTQLIGGTAPDLVQLGRLSDDVVSRYFRPITAAVEQPNPYNAGTAYAKATWRSTFVEGLVTPFVYYPAFQEVYGVPTMLQSIRMYFNLRLLEEVTGSARPPETWAEYRKLCEQVAAFSARTGRMVRPLASVGELATMVQTNAVEYQTQRLRQSLDSLRVLAPTQPALALAYLRNEWSLKSPGVTGGLEVFQEYSRGMTPGFLQLKREDSTFYFLQERSVALIGAVLDYHMLAQDATFPFTVRYIVMPDSSDPQYGANTLGTASESASGGLNGVFGIARTCEHPEVALDFLRYLTSYPVLTRYSKTAEVVPPVVDVEQSDPNLRIIQPRLDGPVGGLSLAFGPATLRWSQVNAFQLVRAGTSVTDFVIRNEPAFREAVADDLRRTVADQTKTSQRGDTTLVAAWYTDPERAEKLSSTQIALDLENAQLRTGLAASKKKPTATKEADGGKSKKPGQK